jgi:hypothetical protein
MSYRIRNGHNGYANGFSITIRDVAGIEPALLLGTHPGDTIGRLVQFIADNRGIDNDRVKFINNETLEYINNRRKIITENLDLTMVVADEITGDWDTVPWNEIDGERATDLLFDHYLEDGYNNTPIKLIDIIATNLTRDALKTLHMYVTYADRGLPSLIYDNQRLRDAILDAIRRNPNHDPRLFKNDEEDEDEDDEEED